MMTEQKKINFLSIYKLKVNEQIEIWSICMSALNRIEFGDEYIDF